MAVITGRYGAVQAARPIQEPGEGFNDTWGSNSLKSAIGGHEDGLELFIPEGDNLSAGVAPPTILSSITSWSLENQVTAIEYAASNTRGYKGKLEGLHDVSGNINGLGAVPPLAPGQRFRFFGFTGSSRAVPYDGHGMVYGITGLVNSAQIQISYQWNSPISWSIGWQSDWQEDGDELLVMGPDEGRGFWDMTTVPCCELLPSKSKNLVIYDEEGHDLTEEGLCLLDANIQFTNETAQYANSCSAKAGGWQSRLAGPNSCTVSTTIQGDDFRKAAGATGLPGKDRRVMIFVGDDECKDKDGNKVGISCWDFNSLFFTGFTGLNVDTTSNTPLQFSCNMDFNAFPGCEAGFIRFCRDWKEVGDNEWMYLVKLGMTNPDG